MPKLTNDAILVNRANITMKKAVANILAAFDSATPADIESGMDWYGDAGAIVTDLAYQGNVSRECAAAVIAHLSPRTTWSRNVAGAYGLILNGEAPSCIGANVARANAAIAAFKNGADPIATVKGPKTSAFARNLLGDKSAVTVDVWAARIALIGADEYKRGVSDDSEKALSRAGVYGAIAAAYIKAAQLRGVTPTAIQATSWIVIRNGRAA